MSDTLADLPAVVTARLRLVPLRPEDAAALSAITDDPAITSSIHFLRSPFTPAHAEALIRAKGDGRECFIGVWRGQELIGVVGAHLAPGAQIEIGYWIARAVHGQGYATEAAAAVIALLQRQFPARRIFAECRRDNSASWRVLEKLGFRAIGAAGARPGRERLTLDQPTPRR